MKNYRTLLIVLIIPFVQGFKLVEDSAFSKDKLVGVWRFKGLTVKSGNSAEVDEFSQLPPCEQDDILEFVVDNSFKETEGNTKCHQPDPQIIDEGTWELKGSTLTMKTGNGLFAGKVLQLDGHVLRFSMTYDIGGQSAIATATYWNEHMKNPKL